MICTCGNLMIKVNMPWIKSTGRFCTKCGQLARLDYKTGIKTVYWRSRRYGKKVS